jgi:hypothetical protein
MPEDRNEKERVATLTSFSILDSYDMKSLLLKFDHDIFSGFKMASLTVGTPIFQLFYEMK